MLLDAALLVGTLTPTDVVVKLAFEFAIAFAFVLAGVKEGA